MDALGRLVDYILEHEPALADTLATMLDDEIRAVIEQGTQEVKEGKTLPIETILDD